MGITVEKLRAEHARLEQVRDRLWGELNQAIGASKQLELLIAHLEAPEPKKTRKRGKV